FGGCTSWEFVRQEQRIVPETVCAPCLGSNPTLDRSLCSRRFCGAERSGNRQSENALKPGCSLLRRHAGKFAQQKLIVFVVTGSYPGVTRGIDARSPAQSVHLDPAIISERWPTRDFANLESL